MIRRRAQLIQILGSHILTVWPYNTIAAVSNAYLLEISRTRKFAKEIFLGIWSHVKDFLLARFVRQKKAQIILGNNIMQHRPHVIPPSAQRINPEKLPRFLQKVPVYPKLLIKYQYASSSGAWAFTSRLRSANLPCA